MRYGFFLRVSVKNLIPNLKTSAGCRCTGGFKSGVKGVICYLYTQHVSAIIRFHHKNKQIKLFFFLYINNTYIKNEVSFQIKN
jgi:hypothetical protein